MLVKLPPERPAAAVAEALRGQKILVRAETTPPLTNHLRITVGAAAQADRFLRAWKILEEPSAVGKFK